MTLSWFRPEVLWWLLAVPVVILLPLLVGRARLRVRPAAMMIRGGILALLVLALAGPVVLLQGPTTTTMFLVDESDSVQSGSLNAARGWMESAIDSAGGDDAVMISTFAGSTVRLTGPVEADRVDTGAIGAGSDGDAGTTDIQQAISQAGAQPVGGARIVLLSDGAETAGMARAEIDTLVQAGIPVDVVHLRGVEAGEFRITGVSGPSVTWAGSDEQLTAYVDAGVPGPATVSLRVDGSPVDAQQVELQGGSAAVPFDLPRLEPGFHVVEVGLEGNGFDNAVTENNTWPLGILVRDAPKVAVVSPVGGDSGRLVDALETRGVNVEPLTSPDLVERSDDLTAWDVIVLNNVPAWDLDAASQSALVAFARAGGGVMVVGGTASFGPGAYATTTLESMLPLTVKVTDGRDRPRVAVLLVIDRSGSMSYGESTSGAPKIELAMDGVITAASALVNGDQVGVIAFNDEPVWALPMTTLEGENPTALIGNALTDLHPDGGTELFPALQVAIDGLRNVDADVRHIIVLSDGRSRGAERDSYFRLLDDAGADGITISTVALGVDADLDLLQDLASAGNGRFHYVGNPNEIPQVTFEEARAAGSQSVLRGSFQPVQLVPSPIMADVSASEMPPMSGYNFAGAKPGAEVVLTSDRRDPLLANWQFGLGRVLAWTGDSGTDFNASWSTWDGYDNFWGNVLDLLLPDPSNQQFDVQVNRHGQDAVVKIAGTLTEQSGGVELTVRDANGAVLAGPVDASDVTDGIAVPVDSGPAWQVEVSSGQDREVHAVTLSPGAEWQPDNGGGRLLDDLAGATGGRIFGLDDDPAEVFDAPDDHHARQEARAVWWAPAVVAMMLFLVDIGSRLGVRFGLMGTERAT